ncbi:hypothetical protein [Clostridium perfringens]|uniref:hypothetical protein n=1 Tax=Clostridium perfringens TaxID=1502 RepID=UPI0024BD16EE|nr:hypothetical protein [Clostridium perfringens]
MDDSQKLGFLMSAVVAIAIAVGSYGLYLTYETHKEQNQQLATEGYIVKDGMRFYPNDTVEIPIEENGKQVWGKAQLESDSYENIYIVNPKNGRYKIYKHGVVYDSSFVMAGNTPVYTSEHRDAPMPWGEEGVLINGAKISDK